MISCICGLLCWLCSLNIILTRPIHVGAETTIVLFVFSFWDRVSWSPHCHQTHYIKQGRVTSHFTCFYFPITGLLHHTRPFIPFYDWLLYSILFILLYTTFCLFTSYWALGYFYFLVTRNNTTRKLVWVFCKNIFSFLLGMYLTILFSSVLNF